MNLNVVRERTKSEGIGMEIIFLWETVHCFVYVCGYSSFSYLIVHLLVHCIVIFHYIIIQCGHPGVSFSWNSVSDIYKANCGSVMMEHLECDVNVSLYC